METEILIVGASCGGVAAALAACDAGRTVVLTEPTKWIGGQLTSQAVPPDENQWVDDPGPVGANMSYKMFRTMTREWYRLNRSLKERHETDPLLNPGGGWVSRLCIEPAVAHSCLVGMLSPHLMSGSLRILTETVPVGADVDGDVIRSVSFERGGERTVIAAKYVLDATEDGALLPIAGAEHAIGAESRATYGEMHAPAEADELDQQACSWCFALEHDPEGEHVIEKPARYDSWRGFVPEMAADSEPWCGPLFDWTVPSHNEEGKRTFGLTPWPDEPSGDEWEMWRYRRIVDRSIYAEAEGDVPPDVCLVNWVQMDYWQKPLLGVSHEQRDAALAEAREQSDSFLYWMQTEAPRHDGGNGYPGLKLRGEELGTEDGFAIAPYIREPRRLLARTMLTEAHVGTDQRKAEGRPGMDTAAHGHEFGSAEAFADTIAVGHYQIDLHPSVSGRNSVYVPCAPYRVPLGSLVPQRMTNLLAASKCLGVSHVVNGTTRVHHSEWAIGEAAGATAAYCLNEDTEPHALCDAQERASGLIDVLAVRGAALRWPWDEA